MTLIKDVKYGSRRSELIFFLLDLMDEKYQDKWLKDNGGYGFDSNIGFAVEIIFDELDIDSYLSQKKNIKDIIGIYLKDTVEAIALLKLANLMDDLLKDVFKSKSVHTDTGTDNEYLASPFLIPMRKAAQDCFVEFIKNEKDNKKFCEFVLKVISSDHFFIPNSEKNSYENIVDYIQSVNIE